MRILLTGVPGSGKSFLGILLKKKFSMQFFSLTDFIVENKLYTEYDEELKTYLYEDSIVEKHLLDHLQDNYIIESHSPQSLKNIPFTHIVYLSVPLKILHSVYESRKYNDRKIRENIDVACFDIIREEIEEFYPSIPVIEYDRTVDTIDKIIKIMKFFYS